MWSQHSILHVTTKTCTQHAAHTIRHTGKSFIFICIVIIIIIIVIVIIVIIIIIIIINIIVIIMAAWLSGLDIGLLSGGLSLIYA